MGFLSVTNRNDQPSWTGETGALRIGLAAVIFIAAIVTVYLVQPEALLPAQEREQAQEPSQNPVEGAEPAQTGKRADKAEDEPEDHPAQPAPPAVRDQAPQSEQTEGDGELVHYMWGYVRERAAQVDWSAPFSEVSAAALTGRADRQRRLLEGPEREIPALNLGAALRERDAVVRWTRLRRQYPVLESLDPALVSSRVLAVWPTQDLIALGAPMPVLREICEELGLQGTPCETGIVVSTDVSRFLPPDAEEAPASESPQAEDLPRNQEPADQPL